MRTALFVLFFTQLVFGNAFAKSLIIPLKLENNLIEQVIKKQIFTDKKNALRINDDGSGCQFIELTQPKVKTDKNALKIRLSARVRFGQPVGDQQCLFFVKWNGYIDLYNNVKSFGKGKKVKISITKSELLTRQGKKDQLGDAVWQALKSQFYPKLRSLTIDLQTPINDIQGFLPHVITQRNNQQLQQALTSIAVNQIKVKPYGIFVGLKVDVPNLKPVTKTSTSKLTHTELALLRKKLDAIDAFVTFTLKQLLKPTSSIAMRSRLLEILFDARYEIVKILEEPNNSGVDPVRILFLDTWRSISPVIRQLFERQNDQVFAMHLVSFVTANDALASIDQYGPELGLDISVDGLRRLARLLNNDPALEPLQLDNKMDPELRKFFGIPAVDEKSQNEMNMLWLDYFVTPAFASGKLPRKLTSKLNNWVPKKREISQYLPMVKKVLTAVGQSQLRRKKLNRKFRRVYQNLVYAAAWQESCWKQFVAVKGFRKPMRSRSGDLGLMQINPRVWRGFYDMHKIKWDIVYNANAGAEILMHYLTRYVIKNKEHIKTGKIDNLARAAYSGYNGGPRQYTRYRKMKIPRKLKRIDQAFYKKYRAVRDRGPLAVKSCYTGI